MMDASPTRSPEAPDEITLSGDTSMVERGPDDLLPGTLVGRYLIIGRIGAGAMGVVFAAYDPELDRKIALKLLHARGGATLDARARLLREAKSLARLSHPNVVAVHDVGTYGDHVFLAMEFVAGRTLTAWLKDQPRRWPEVVEVLSRAGEGLAAAHDAGLVHRDFKPDNVLIGDDGRVRVLDFGLARSADAVDSPTASDALAALSSASISASRSRESEREQNLVTRTGALIGTPAYMSPEQHLGKPADAFSDQFSFCVTLYQALYGVRPFTGTRLSALAFQIIQGKVEAAPAGARVPAWVRKVVVRGLAINPDQRHPSMRALLAALHRDGGVARRSAWAALGLGGLGLGLGVWLASAAEPPCQGAALKLAGVWDEERIEAIASAFLASRVPYAADTWHSTRAALSAYAEKWKKAHHEACAATHIQHEQSEQMLDLRMRCLDRRLGRLAALSNSLLHPTTSAIEHAPEAISTLGDLGACDDAETLSAVVQPPDDPDKVAEIEAKIAAASAHELSAELTPAYELSSRATDEAVTLGYGPLEAEALLVDARVKQRLGKYEAGADSLANAIVAASRGRDDRLAATAWVDLAFHTGAFQPDAVKLATLRLAAETAIARAGDDLWLRARLHQAVATGLQRLGQHEEALTLLLPAIKVLESEPDREPARLLQALNLAGIIYHEQRAFEQAQKAFESTLAAGERLYGPSHPSLASVHNNFAELALDMDDVELAARHVRESADVVDRTLPPGHIGRAEVARSAASVADVRGDLAGARAKLEEAIAIYAEQPEADRMHTASLYNDLAIVVDRQGDHPRAREHYRAALKLFRDRFGANHVYARIVESNLAEISLALDEPAAALAIVDRLLATVPDDAPIDPPLPYLLCLRAQSLLALGRVADAREPADRAVKLIDAGEGGAIDAEHTAIVQATLARVLAAAAVEPETRRRLAFLAEPVLKAADTTTARRALDALAALSPGVSGPGPSAPSRRSGAL